ncbi:hypothetical protein Smic_74950 [Streptomyces microflavus]|uniref:4Fe-4S Mo/W bis-MGD-type domain-containing protein n=1 Tax=Streptomyces microflavus TaxID=1919 RepID=A0A7J0D373_STRMI|nr:hypothetical protein Smic_74950 [Streptomyces microflavus]
MRSSYDLGRGSVPPLPQPARLTRGEDGADGADGKEASLTKPEAGVKAEVESVRTVCSYCGVGCGILLDIGRDASTGRRIAKKVSGDRTHPANSGRLCTKGATSADMMAAPGRAAKALIRAERGADPVEADVDAAITAVAGRLRAIVDEHGPDALALYVSGQMSLEAQYLANKLAKGFVRTSRIESNSRLCMASAGSGYKLSLGADGPLAPTGTSTGPMSSSSSARTWPTATRSSSSG